MNNIKKLYFDKIDASEGIDIDKTSASKSLSFNHMYAINGMIY